MPHSPKVTRTPQPSVYSVHPSVAMVQDWIAGLKAKTGRSLDEWMLFIRKNGPETEQARRDWLKNELKLGTNTAAWFAERSVGKSGEDDSPEAYLASAPKYVEAMYAAKPGIRPIHDRLVEIARGLGPDVRICPCATIVPLYRAHVFAQIKPSTKTRLDLGLALAPLLKASKARIPARLIDTGGFQKKDRITHRIPLASVQEIDDEVHAWLKRAYELDA